MSNELCYRSHLTKIFTIKKLLLMFSELLCRGRCADGGRPMCFYSRDHKIVQFSDVNGPHCMCYDGFTGHQCDMVEKCGPQRSVESFGSVDWGSTSVNQSASVPCPYNSDGTKLERHCLWDKELFLAKWENVSFNDICKKQSSVLVHLGVLANYVQRPDQTSAGFNAVQRFLDSILRFPAFMNNVSTAHFDDKIAEHTVQVRFLNIKIFLKNFFCQARSNVKCQTNFVVYFAQQKYFV